MMALVSLQGYGQLVDERDLLNRGYLGRDGSFPSTVIDSNYDMFKQTKHAKYVKGLRESLPQEARTDPRVCAKLFLTPLLEYLGNACELDRLEADQRAALRELARLNRSKIQFKIGYDFYDGMDERPLREVSTDRCRS